MPTISFSLSDLNTLVGRDIPLDELGKLAEYAKGDFEGYDKETDEVKMNFEDTNLPYLWCVEGFAILLKGVLDIEKGIPKVNLMRSDEKIIVSPDVQKIRPFIAAFSAKGRKVDDYLLKQIIQLQEKLCEGYGRKRQKVAIGVYTHRKIKFPVYYNAVDPESVEFIPLEFKRPLTLGEILEAHPAGVKYAFTVRDFEKYPLLVDSNRQVLSFPPIINSDALGKVAIGDDDLFVEVTGTDLAAVELCCNILASSMNERGFKIYSCGIDYGKATRITPNFKTEKRVVSRKEIASLLGMDFTDAQVKKYCEMARFGYNKGINGYDIEVPAYRGDILHNVDVIEDIAIMHGYGNIPVSPLSGYTVGGTDDSILLIDNVRNILAGLGFQEVLSPVLSNKEDLYGNMNLEDTGTVEIKEFMSSTYSVVRSWLVPVLMKILSLNKHNDYPQNIFEQGISARRIGDGIVEIDSLACTICDSDADFTRIRQVLDCILKGLGFDYRMEEFAHPSFIPGRVARVFINEKEIAYIGEIHPIVLERLDLQMPVAAFELDLTGLFALQKRG